MPEENGKQLGVFPAAALLTAAITIGGAFVAVVNQERDARRAGDAVLNEDTNRRFRIVSELLNRHDDRIRELEKACR